jgi:hypothetical protein
MDIDDKELFSSATTDEQIPEVTAEPAQQEPLPTASQERAGQDGPARDEHGRFAAKQTEPQPEPQAADPSQAKEEANVPSWRLREVREEAERRVAEAEARWQRQYLELQRQAQPKPEPTPPPDLFENPNGFVDHNVRQLVDPIRAELQQIREENSRYRAEDKHGADKVRASYDWVAQGIAQRDPEAISAYNRAMQSPHPFDVLVTAHQQRTVFQTIGADPNAWFEKELERRMSDPQFAAKLQQSRQSNGQPQGSITKLPPSLRNTPAARGAVEDDNDMSDAALFRHAMR